MSRGDHAGTGAAERLRREGFRATQPRRAVLEWLDGHPGHHPAERIVEGTGLSKATVYHVLGQLSDASLVLAAESGSGRALYETGDGFHHHFVCRHCGRVIDVPCLPGAPPCVDVDVPGATVEHADVILRGTCAACEAGRAGSPGRRRS